MNIIIGTIVGSCGIKGEVKIKSNTDFASIRYKKNNKLTLINPINNNSLKVSVLSYRQFKGMDYVIFEGIDDMDKANNLRGYQIISTENVSIKEEGIYFYNDLYHCNLFYNDSIIGEIIDMFDAGSHLILRVKRENKKDLLYPFVDKFITSVDISNKKIIINPIEGMLD